MSLSIYSIKITPLYIILSLYWELKNPSLIIFYRIDTIKISAADEVTFLLDITDANIVAIAI